MDYAQGKVGRIFSIRFDHGDDFLLELRQLIEKENVRCAWFHVLGGLLEAEVVIGPQKPVMPPEPVWHGVNEAREVIGFGTVFWNEEEPKIHLHAALGHHGDTLTACVRKGTKTYLILEAFLVEVKDLNASRPWFDKGEFFRISYDK